MSPSCLLTLAAAANGTAATGGTGDDSYLVWGAVLFGVALVLLIIELFVPSGGLIGLVSGVAVVGSAAAFFAYDRTWGLAATGVYVVLIPVTLVVIFKYWFTSPIGRRMVLGGEDDDPGVDPQVASATSEHHRRERMRSMAAFVGREGVTETALRPVGIVRIDGRRLDALAEGPVIDAAEPIVVVAAYDNQLKVRPKREAPADAPPSS